MAAGAQYWIRGRGIAGTIGTRRFHPHNRGGRDLGGADGVGEVGGDGGGGGHRKLGAHKGRIEGHGDRIEGEDGWIVVRGRRIGRAGLRINSHGDVYVPDSEDEGTDTEMEDAGADAGAAAVMVPATGSRDVVTGDGAPAMEVAADRSPAMEVDPEVQARLAAVLADIDPVYHAVFVSLYKVMVPAFFKSK